MKKIFFLAIVAASIVFSCSENSNNPIEVTKTKKAEVSGKEVYKTYCVACHGADGKMAFSGAKDLSESSLDLETRILQITHGKGIMNAFKNILSKDEIEKVAVYIEELRVEQ